MKKKFLALLITMLMLFACAFSLTACSDALGDGSFLPSIPSLKLSDTKRCENTTIKTSLATFLITPSGFDFEELNSKNYKMKITVTYDVYYEKDWNAPWDLGYLGAPKFEVCILDDDLVGNMDADITAPSSSSSRTITYTTNVVNLIGSKIYLTFSSDNIQNKIHFKNITVNYYCYK